MCLSKAGLKIGNSDTKDVDIAAPNGAGVDFCINGVLYHKADAADIALTAGHTIEDDEYAIILVLLDADGDLTSVMGDTASLAGVTAGPEQIHFPTPTADTCPIGYIKVLNETGSDFVSGTTALDTSGITDTYVDLFSVPVSPLTS